MQLNRIVDVMLAIVAIAGVTVIIRNGTESAAVITAFGNAFSGSIKAATGQ